MNLCKSIACVLLVTSLIACDTSDGVSKSEYNQQVKKYNDLVETYNQTTKSTVALHADVNLHLSYLLELDRKMKLVSTSYFSLNAASSCTSIESFDVYRNSALQTIIEIEAQNLNLVQELRSSAVVVMKEQRSTAAEALKTYLELNKELDGFRSTLENMQTAAFALNSNCALNRQKSIQLSTQEKTILQQVSIHKPTAIFRSQGQQTIATGQNEILHLAVKSGFQQQTVSQNLDLASLSNGVLGLAASSVELTTIMIDQLSVIKSKMNLNADNLELAFVIDYSGSMSNNIDAVITNLIQLNSGLRSIKQSGRKIKIAIVSFGNPGQEKINLAFTEDLNQVDTTLRSMLNHFSTEQHSIEPGEASYHGLLLALNSLDWKSLNREIMLITDEPSYEASTGMVSVMDRVKKDLGKTTIHPIVVRLMN